jgi:tetratricopeptide (TPR) repeat protein
LHENKLCQHRKIEYKRPVSRPRLIALLLALATLVIYLPAGSYGFVHYDDDDYVVNNPIVQQGLTLAGIKWAFTTFYASNWHPLTWLSHMADCELFGLNPGAHHLVSVIFHAANASLLFILLLRLTGALWPCAFIAALFAWHPLHVESVAWISERKDVLSTFFGLLALLSYTKYAKENSRRDYWLSLFFFALGLMSKPMLVTLPFVMLLLDFWPLQKFLDFKFQTAPARRIIFEKWPFFLLALISCVLTYLAQQRGDSVVSLANVPLLYRLCSAPLTCMQYLLKLFWPSNLCVFYPLHLLSRLEVAAAGTAFVAISCLAWLTRRRFPYGLFGWLWFVGTLVPVIGLVKVGDAALADRYTYLPAIGIFIVATFAARDLANRFHFAKIIFPIASAFVLGGCLILTERQLSYWRDSETLFRHALAVTKDNDIALVNVGVALEEQGRFDEALADYRQAARIAPEHYQIHLDLGNVLEKTGRPAEALAEYREAVRLNPKSVTPHEGLGIVLAELGRFNEATNEFTRAAQLDATYPWPYFQMARVLLQQGRDAGAVDQLRTALRIDPENYQILAYTAHVLAADENSVVRDGKTARELAAKANALTGGSQPFVLDALGMACAETGDFTNAVNATQNALALADALKMKISGPLQQRLELYKKHQPWRESFLATNPPPENPSKN